MLFILLADVFYENTINMVHQSIIILVMYSFVSFLWAFVALLWKIDVTEA